MRQKKEAYSELQKKQLESIKQEEKRVDSW